MKTTTVLFLAGLILIPTTVVAQHGYHGMQTHMPTGMPTGMPTRLPGGMQMVSPGFAAPHFAAPHYASPNVAAPAFAPHYAPHVHASPYDASNYSAPTNYAPTTMGHAHYGTQYPNNGSTYSAYVPPAVHPRVIHQYAFTLGLPYALANNNSYYPGYYSYLYGSPYGNAYGGSQTANPQHGAVNPQNPTNSQIQAKHAAAATAELLSEAAATFKAGKYFQSIKDAGQVAEQQYNLPAAHELMSLGMFALGDFRGAAIEAHAVIYYGHPATWATIFGYYGDASKYSEQLRALESQVKANEDDAAAMFLLGYHYAMLGHKDAAIKMLNDVIKLTPHDIQAMKLLYPLEGKEPPKDNVSDPPKPGSNLAETDGEVPVDPANLDPDSVR